MKIKLSNKLIKNHVNAFNVANGGIINDNLKIVSAKKVENRVVYIWIDEDGDYCINEIIRGAVSHMPIEISSCKDDIFGAFARIS